MLEEFKVEFEFWVIFKFQLRWIPYWSFNSYWRPNWKRAEKMWSSGWERLGRRCWALRGPGPLSFHRIEREVKRCSVKPASRGALHSFRNPDTRAFAWKSGLNSLLGTGKPVKITPSNPTNPARPISSHTNALARVTSSRCWAQRLIVYTTGILKTCFFMFISDVGRLRELLTHSLNPHHNREAKRG